MKKPLLALAALFLASPLLAAQPVEGRWVTEERDAVITIGDCGKSLCGGADQRDVNNRDADLRNRKLLGMPVLTGFTEDGDEWRGQIYDPKSGKTYRSIIRRLNATTLQVKGCLGPFCQTQTWKRAR